MRSLIDGLSDLIVYAVAGAFLVVLAGLLLFAAATFFGTVGMVIHGLVEKYVLQRRWDDVVQRFHQLPPR